jgi:hypothetical protein
VLAKQTIASSGSPPPCDCNTRQSIYADVRPPLNDMHVGSVILNGSKLTCSPSDTRRQ